MRNPTCVMFGDALGDYHFGENHPFGPLRYPAFSSEFEKRGLKDRVSLSTPVQTDRSRLALFHGSDYIDHIMRMSANGNGYLDDGDTPARPGIYEAACTVVGSVLKTVDDIMEQRCRNGFVPIAGLHHARRNAAAGFCVFNDCGVAIEYLREVHGVRRVAYVDIDAHHGDGVFYAFEDDPALCIVDFHQDGNTLYPGTGFIDETGTHDARGTKLNVPLPPATDDKLAGKFWNSAETFIAEAQPEFIILQCGADSLAGDPITHLELSSAFHAHVARRLVAYADTHCQGRLLALGGGGYNLDNIRAAWNDVVEALVE